MDSLRKHNLAWGAPREYAERQVDPQSAAMEYGEHYDRVIEAIHKVARAANWYREQTCVLAAMVMAGDAAAIRRWDLDPLEEGLAEEVEAALEGLADLVEGLSASVRRGEEEER